MFRAISKTITKHLNPEREAARRAFLAQAREHGALWMRDVIRRYSVDQSRGEDCCATLTTSQLWAASSMTRDDLATILPATP